MSSATAERGGEIARHVGLLRASPEVVEFVAARRAPRARARRKIEDVVGRLIQARPPVDRARDLWVHGSYARGAPDVGDIDLFLRVDEARDPARQALESYYRRAHPYAEIVKALGCGGASIVNLDVDPVFSPAPKPISRQRCQAAVPEGYEVPVAPCVRHVVTGDLFDPQPVLLWVRGDSLSEVEGRLDAINEDQNARRFERTTTVPLIDTLLPVLGVQTGFVLAAQIRAGNLKVDATVLAEQEPPPEARRKLASRYQAGSARYRAAAAALAHLKGEGVALERVQLVDEPVTSATREPHVAVSFNSFRIYEAASGNLDDGWRHLHVWPTPRGGRWLALDLRVKNADAIDELYRRLTPLDSKQERHRQIRRALGLPPLASPA